MYGDEAVLYENNSYQKVACIFIDVVLFRPTSVRCSRFLIYAMRSEIMASPPLETLRPVLHAITSSLNLCYDGCDEHGQVLFPEKIRCCVAELRGDQAWFRMLFRHRSYWGAKKVCFKCGANITNRFHTNTALWMGTERNTPRFVAEELPFLPCASGQQLTALVFFVGCVFSF